MVSGLVLRQDHVMQRVVRNRDLTCRKLVEALAHLRFGRLLAAGPSQGKAGKPSLRRVQGPKYWGFRAQIPLRL